MTSVPFRYGPGADAQSHEENATMITISDHRFAGVRRNRAPDLVSRVVYATSFPIFLAVALGKRLLPRGLRPVTPGEPKSVLAEAGAAARTCMVFASMG
jgi:hypothetical protein